MSSRSNNCQGYFIHQGKESKDISADALFDWLGVTNVASQLKDDAQVESQFYTLQEVSQQLKISERTIHNLLNASEWSGMLIARRWKLQKRIYRRT